MLLILCLIGGAAGALHAQDLVIVKYNNASPFQEAEKALRETLRQGGIPERNIHSLLLPDQGASLPPSVPLKAVDCLFLMGNTTMRRYAEDPAFAQVPIIYSMVTAPEAGGAPAGRSLPGISLDVSPEQKLRALTSFFPSGARIGLLYTPGTIALVQQYQAAADGLKTKLITLLVDASSKVPAAFERIQGLCDILLLIPDPTLLTRENQQYFFSQGGRFPICGLSRTYVEKGMLLAIDADYREQGQAAARLCFDLKQGREAKRLSPRGALLYANREAADRLHLKPASPDVIWVDGHAP